MPDMIDLLDITALTGRSRIAMRLGGWRVGRRKKVDQLAVALTELRLPVPRSYLALSANLTGIGIRTICRKEGEPDLWDRFYPFEAWLLKLDPFNAIEELGDYLLQDIHKTRQPKVYPLGWVKRFHDVLLIDEAGRVYKAFSEPDLMPLADSVADAINLFVQGGPRMLLWPSWRKEHEATGARCRGMNGAYDPEFDGDTSPRWFLESTDDRRD